MEKEKFQKLFDQAIKLWPDQIATFEKVKSGSGCYIPELTKIHDEVEKKILLFDDYDLRHIDWAIYTILHQQARTTDMIFPPNVDTKKVEEVYIKNTKS